MTSHTVTLFKNGYVASTAFLRKWLFTIFFLAWEAEKRVRGWWRRRGRHG